ncbi:DEAD/DEAH box helicase [Acetobacter sp.]|uniref:DEAD/DEAH box helicase n=1 Tax=Acetobacter sp. TaxID=440 RepID=UPI0039E970D6
MRNELPENHGLFPEIVNNPLLMPMNAENPSLTEAQFAALTAGSARGQNVLISAPTSTGKTLIGWWAIATSLRRNGRTVYLVSHRALAKQKFEEAQRLFIKSYLNDDQSSIVCATGDSVEDASGRKTSSPLSATVLIATYEKYLGCLSTGGPPRDLRDVTFICDEVQLIGDKTRGKSVELLLTLIKRAGWRQFVGLSAVLSPNDAASIADWLGLTLVRSTFREKPLQINCLSSLNDLSITVAPNLDGDFISTATRHNIDLIPLILNQIAQPESKPVIVFCMKVDETFELSAALARQILSVEEVTRPPGVDISIDLIALLQKRIAYHNAEISEEERLFVETRLAGGLVDVVFSTSTLAAGVNFPLGSAIFASWKRWDPSRRARFPISRAEFQNMAGRVGRMGQTTIKGSVILISENQPDMASAKALMDLRQHDDLGVGINPADFGPLVLQIFAGRLCSTRTEALILLKSTLSAAREYDRNQAGLASWKSALDSQIDRLISAGCLLEAQTSVVVTSLGLSVARSGLKPETAQFFFRGMATYAATLTSLLPDGRGNGSEDDIAFVLIHAALCSPEFNYTGGEPTRVINWRIGNPGLLSNPFARRLQNILFEQPWVANSSAANGANVITSWIAGASREVVEATIPSVRLGTIQALSRDVAWILTGISDIIGSITSSSLADEAKPPLMRGNGPNVIAARQLARTTRRLAARINTGLPSDVLWMLNLELQNGLRRLSRAQILSLRAAGLNRLSALMSGEAATTTQRIQALGGSQRTANAVRNAARVWKIEDLAYCKVRHLKRAASFSIETVIENLYEQRGNAFELAFEAALNMLAIPFQKLDTAGKIAFPDYLVTIDINNSLVFELKTKTSNTDSVSMNDATDVLRASELANLKENFCVTLCSPAVEPSVPSLIENCGRLCVIEVCDFVEAILRVREGTLTRGEFHNWLSTPGAALRDDLPPPH